MKNKLTPKASHRAHIFYSGRVQGVGFRFTAQKLALELGLTGWARNLPDGRVEIVCEGPKEEIEHFLEKIRRAFGGRIQKTVYDWENPAGQFKDFTIEFCC